jgi:hypothetical protein
MHCKKSLIAIGTERSGIENLSAFKWPNTNKAKI